MPLKGITMDIKRKLAVKLMKKLSYHTADLWDNEKLEKKLNSLLSARLVEKGHKLDSEEATAFLDKVLENQGSIKIIEPDETPEENGYPKVKELKPGSVVEEKPKPKKVKKEKIMTENTEKKAKEKKLSVTAFIVSCLQKEHLSREELCDKIKQQFPERDSTATQKMVQNTIPWVLVHEKKLNVQKDESGKFFI